MKLLLFILALTLYQIPAQTTGEPGGYTAIDTSQLNQNQNLQDILTFGAHYTVQQGIQAGDIEEANYEVTAVYGAWSQVVSGVNYMFDVEIKSDQGTILRASYIVYDQSWTSTREVTKYTYDIVNDAGNGELENLEFLPDDVYESSVAIAGGWTELDLQEAETDAGVQSLLTFGVQYITQQEISAQKIPDGTYTVSQLHSVWTQVVSGTNYRFDADITNDLGWVLRATFIVYSQPWTNTQQVTSYVYDVTTNPNSSQEEEFVLPDEEDLAGGYEPIDPSQLNTNTDLKNSLDAGVQYVVGQAVADHTLPDSTYQVTQVNSIYGQVVSGMNYRFDVDITNCAGLVVRAVFVVYSQIWSNTQATTPGTLDITNIPDEGLIGGDCTNEGNGNGNEEEFNFGGEENLLVGGYSPVDLGQALNDPTIKKLLNYGAQFVASQGIQDHSLPDSRYTVSKVFGVAEQVVEGLNYKFDVQLVNCQGLTVRTTYVVNYISWENSMEVIDYVYDITAIPNGLFIGGCPNEGGEEETTWASNEEGNNEEEPIAGGWSTVDPQDAQNDQDLQNALVFGVPEFVAKAIANGDIPDDQYVLGHVNSIEQQVVSGTNYQFNVDVVSTSGNTDATVILHVYSQPWTDTLQLTSYDIVAISGTGAANHEEESTSNEEGGFSGGNNEEEGLSGGWTIVDPQDAQNDQQIQDALAFGVQEFAKEATGDGKIPNDQYELADVNSVEQQVVSGMNYKFDVDVLGSDGTTVRVVLNVYSQTWTNTLELTSYSILAVGPSEEESQ